MNYEFFDRLHTTLLPHLVFSQATMEESLAVDTTAPPPYVEVPVATESHAANGTSGADATRRDLFLQKANGLRRSHEAESLRTFLLTLLKIDYDLGCVQLFQPQKADLQFGRYFRTFTRSYRSDFPGQAGKASEVDCFVESIADLLQILKLEAEYARRILLDFQATTLLGQVPYRSMIEFGPVCYLPQKFLRDRNHTIDALVPKNDPTLRAQLHRLLQEEQSRWFIFVQSPADYELTPDGRFRLLRERKHQTERGTTTAKQQTAVAKKEEVVVKGKSGGHQEHKCVLF